MEWFALASLTLDSRTRPAFSSRFVKLAGLIRAAACDRRPADVLADEIMREIFPGLDELLSELG